MDSDKVFDEFNMIIQRKPGAEPDQGSNDDTEQTGEPSHSNTQVNMQLADGEDDIWIPKVKQLVQFVDRRNNIQVRPLEEFAPEKPPALADVDRRWRHYSFILRRVLDANYNDQECRLELRSPGLQKIFREIGKPFTELRLDKDPIIIPHPFRCLFHLRDQMKALEGSDTTPREEKQELAELLSFISEEPALQQIAEPYDELVSKGTITRDLHWALFRPHEWVYMKRNLGSWVDFVQEECVFVTDIEERPVRADDTDKSTHLLRYVRTCHDGKTFGLTKHGVTFGSRSKEVVRLTVRDLALIPMRLLDTQERSEIRKRLTSRGERYRALSEGPFALMHYRGMAALTDQNEIMYHTNKSGIGHTLTASCDQRVIVDGVTGREMLGVHEDDHLVASCLEEYLNASDAGHNDKPMGSTHAKNVWNQGQRWATREWTENDYLTCPPTLVAFLLREKTWARIHVENLTGTVWSVSPFLDLQLEVKKKALVHNLASVFIEMSSRTFGEAGDFAGVRGGGGGLVILLEGPRGVGKSFTAESVAETANRPLYHVSAGDLAVDARLLEKQLAYIFGLGSRWGAVVLIDDIDHFIDGSASRDPSHNAAVTVFFRHVENFAGLLFLTARAEQRPARDIHDRIHMTIEYSPLDDSQRANIWRQCLERPHGHGAQPSSRGWSDEAYRLLGQIDASGRGIRNYVRAAEHLAFHYSEDLSARHIVTIIENNKGYESSKVREICERLVELGKSKEG